MVTDRVIEAIEARPGLDFEPIGEVTLKGFPEPTALFLRPRAAERAQRHTDCAASERDGMPRARSAPMACLPPGRPVVAMLSGGRDSVCLLDLAVRLLGPEAVTALHVNYGLRDEAPTTTSATAPASASGSGCGSRSSGPAPGGSRQPAGLGARRSATRPRRALALDATDAAIATGHTADDQVETILYRLASSPSRRALLGMRAARRQPGAAAARLHPCADDRLLRGARARLARRREQRRRLPTPATAFATGSRPALAEVHPAAAANVLRTAELLRDEAEVLDAPGRRRARRLRRRAARHDRARAAGRAAAGAAPPRRPAARRPRRRPPGPRRRPPRRRGRRPCAAPATAMLDLGGGVRAVAERGVLRAERD